MAITCYNQWIHSPGQFHENSGHGDWNSSVLHRLRVFLSFFADTNYECSNEPNYSLRHGSKLGCPKPRHELCSRLLQSCYGSNDWIWFGYDWCISSKCWAEADGNRWQPMATAWSNCRLVELDSWQGLLAWRHLARIPPFFRKEFFAFQAPHVLSRWKISKHHQYNSVQLSTVCFWEPGSDAPVASPMPGSSHLQKLVHAFVFCSLPLSATWTWN